MATKDLLANITVIETDDGEKTTVSEQPGTVVISDGGLVNGVYIQAYSDVIVDTEKEVTLLFHGDQINNGSGGDGTYVRPTPMDITVGGAVVGTTFDGTITEALDVILYPYQEPAFTSFAISGYNILEVGDEIPTGSQTFNWNTSNDANVQLNSIKIENISDTVTYATGLANDDTETVTFSQNVQRTTVGTKTFRITGTNTQAGTFTRDDNVSWYWNLYYGESTNTSLTEAQIEALRVSLLTNSRNRTYSMLGGGYKYFCWSTSLGQPTSFKDAATGFAVAMESPATVNVTNSFGHSQDYYVYRTTNQLAGSIDIEVS